ncbi:MAG TPA: EpsG family protein [Sphingomonadaceae bacterium]
MPYLPIYLLAALAAFAFRRSPRTGKTLYPVLLVFFFIVTAFRFEVGCDWVGYLVQYKYDIAFEAQDAPTRDPLWWWYLRTFRTLGLPYPWLNIVPTIVFFAGAHALARRQPDRFAFLVLLWPVLIINIAMSGLRQAAAIGIVCFAFNAFVERRVVVFTLLVLLASTIHSSAIGFLLLVPLVTGNYSRSRLALAALLALPGAALIVSSSAGEIAVNRYVSTGTDATGAAFRVALLAMSGVAFFALLRRPWLATHAADYKLMSIGSLGMIGLVALLPLSTVIADRLGYYLVPVQAIMLARIPVLPLIRFRTFYVLGAYAALGMTLAVWVLFSDHFQQCYVPYRIWLFGMPQTRYGI